MFIFRVCGRWAIKNTFCTVIKTQSHTVNCNVGFRGFVSIARNALAGKELHERKVNKGLKGERERETFRRKNSGFENVSKVDDASV